MTARPRTASDLWAEIHGSRRDGTHENAGPLECHYCGAACGRGRLHDDPPPVPFVRSVTSALRPGSPYQCNGCWLWGRSRVTVAFPGGGVRDRQDPALHSWLFWEGVAWALRGPEDAASVYPVLLDPPAEFFLALRTAAGPRALLQCCRLARPGATAADDVEYTLDNRPAAYSPYELEHALRHGRDGVGGGALAVLDFLGPWRRPEWGEAGAPGERGRPAKGEGGGNPSARPTAAAKGRPGRAA